MSVRFIRIKCNECDCLLRVSAEHAGKRVRCPDGGCGGVTRLPTHEAMRDLGLSEAPNPIPPEASESPSDMSELDA